ncbi:MAG: hypothetical protein QME68_04325, partial [Elusimicrobiota bacterium]|nr:hypothetical protein [Elusimicrobiota bacterium]
MDIETLQKLKNRVTKLKSKAEELTGKIKQVTTLTKQELPVKTLTPITHPVTTTEAQPTRHHLDQTG